MESAAASPRRIPGHLDAFSKAIASLREQGSQDDVLARVPGIFCEGFGAVRSEIWLWDEPSKSGYLTHAAGAEAKHWRDYFTQDSGSLGHAAASQVAAQNLLVSEAGKDSFDFVQRAQLTHMSVFPLAANGKMVAVSVNYSTDPAPAEVLACWRALAEIAGISLLDAKS